MPQTITTVAPVKKSAKFKRLCKKYGVNPDNVPEILSLEDAYKAIGEKPSKIRIVGAPKRHVKRMISDCELSIIAEAINEKRRPNYSDHDEYKMWPYFKVQADAKRPSGFGLSYDDCADWTAGSTVGVRLCFPHHDYNVARDRAIFFGKHFLPQHIDHHLYS